MRALFRQRYRVLVQGLDNIPASGGVLLLGNHISWIDWAFIQIACKRPVRFVLSHRHFDKRWLKWLMTLMRCIPIRSDDTSPESLDAVTASLDAGHVVCMFPEGSVSRTGHLAEFRHGYETAAAHAGAAVVIVPFYLRGLWGSLFSSTASGLNGQRRSFFRREVIVTFGQALAKDTPADLLKRRIFDLSMAAWDLYAQRLTTIPDAWIRTARRRSRRTVVIDPIAGTLNGTRALTGAILLARRIGRLSPEANVGILLPSSAAGALTNIGAMLAGKTVVNLNFTASDDAFRHALAQADIGTIYTSRRFLERLQQRGRDLTPLLEGVKIVFAEDLRDGIGKFERARTWLAAAVLPTFALRAAFCRASAADDTAVILFSSGSEGMPKGVMLSHRNILVNAAQVAAALNLEERDVVLASLPLFHAFGLNAMLLMPLVIGVPFVCHPDPTDVAGIAKTVARHRATIMCSTTSFLRLFVRNPKVDPTMLASLRLVVAGAEPLKPEVRDAFQARFGVDVFEGYGCTETAPVAGANLPDASDSGETTDQVANKPGTLGMPLHGTSYRIVDPDTFEELATGEEGMILISGPQVMQGYLKDSHRTAEAIHVIDGQRWFITGDKGSLDADGFLTIRDRYSRFAKIAGEMVSLSEVENAVLAQLSDTELEVVAVSVPDARKGEAIVVLHEGQIDTRATEKAMLADGIPGLMIPSRWIAVDSVPKLGSGKTDFVTAKSLAIGE